MARRRFYGKNREQRISGEICRESCFQITSEPILNRSGYAILTIVSCAFIVKSWDRRLKKGRLVYGVDIVRGPEVTIKRNPLWQKF